MEYGVLSVEFCLHARILLVKNQGRMPYVLIFNIYNQRHNHLMKQCMYQSLEIVYNVLYCCSLLCLHNLISATVIPSIIVDAGRIWRSSS